MHSINPLTKERHTSGLATEPPAADGITLIAVKASRRTGPNRAFTSIAPAPDLKQAGLLRNHKVLRALHLTRLDELPLGGGRLRGPGRTGQFPGRLCTLAKRLIDVIPRSSIRDKQQLSGMSLGRGAFRFWGEPMSYYRLYLMDGLSGHVTSFIEIEAGTDADAISQAETHRGNVAMELWCGRKKVKRWAADFGSSPHASGERPD